MSKGKEVVVEELSFNPHASTIRSYEQLLDYLGHFGYNRSDDIKISLAPKGFDMKKAPKEKGSVYIAALVLALGAYLPIPPFAREVLAHYQLAPT